jgi:hypothetical protein
MDRFNAALRQVVQVSKQDLNRLLAADKSAKAAKKNQSSKPKSSSARAVNESD